MRRNFLFILTGILMILCWIIACEPEYPSSPWNPGDKGRLTPIINSIIPSDGSYEGVGIITIRGENLSHVKEENIVFYDGNRGTILEACDTQLVVQNAVVIEDPSVNVLDSVKIQVAVIGSSEGETGAYPFAEYFPYRLERGAIEYGAFSEFNIPHALACDSEENLYVATEKRKIYKVYIDSATDSLITEEYVSSTGILIITGMKMGPGGYLYITRNHKNIYTIPPGGGSKETFVKLSGKVYDLDFDQNDVLYAVGKGDSIYSVKSDASFFGSAEYVDFVLRSLRVYNGYVYVSGEYNGSDSLITKMGIWRNQILSADGDLGDRELVFDWTSTWSGEFGPAVLSITFDENGDLYIGSEETYSGSKYTGGDAITILDMDDMTTTSVLYSPILFPPASNMVWGNSNYLYVTRLVSDTEADGVPTIRVIRIALELNGATYNGRQ